MSKQFDELIALSCPDLKANGDSTGGSQVLVIESKRRSSIVKPMTATELAKARAAMIEESKVVLQNRDKGTKTNSLKIASSTALNLCTEENTGDSLNAKSKSLPSFAAPPSHISSLPNLQVEAMEQEMLGLYNRTMSAKIDSKAAKEIGESSDSKSSIDDCQTSKSTSIADSIELLRMQQEREREHKRNRTYSCSPSHSRSADINQRYDHERSAAPDRLHSSSLSSVRSSAVSTSMSASVSVNGSKNTSRRASTDSYTAEAENSQLTLTQPMKATPNGQIIFPISNTNSSTPNVDSRNSNISTFFPGVLQLSKPEPAILKSPNILEKTLQAAGSNTKTEDSNIAASRGKFIHRTRTPPPLGVKLGVNLKKVTPPRTQISVKKNVAPMLGVVLRKVEKKSAPFKSILDDDKPLYHFSIVRSDNKEYKPEKPKPKPKPVEKPNPGGISTGPQIIRQPPIVKLQKPMPGVPITIQKIEGDKIIIIKKIIVPKNSKIPEQYLKVGPSSCNVM